MECLAAQRGQYTLDIYLLNIIILEMTAGPIYRKITTIYGSNFLHEHGLLFEIVATFIVTCVMMEIIVTVGRLMNQNRYMAKIFFYRDIR